MPVYEVEIKKKIWVEADDREDSKKKAVDIFDYEDNFPFALAARVKLEGEEVEWVYR